MFVKIYLSCCLLAFLYPHSATLSSYMVYSMTPSYRYMYKAIPGLTFKNVVLTTL